MKKIIHINQHVIKKNSKTGERSPVITCKTYKENVYGYRVKINNGEVVYSPDKPLSCGAKVWIETDDVIGILTEDGWIEMD
jgi:hypothetical protein